METSDHNPDSGGSPRAVRQPARGIHHAQLPCRRRTGVDHPAGDWDPGALAQRDPLLVAKQAATLHHLSAGRFTLGLAVGWIAKYYSFLRTDFGNRGLLDDEYIQAIRVLFESDHPEFHGEHINFSEALFSPRPKLPIPIVVGGTSKAALRRAAILGDGWYGLRLSPDATEVAIGTIDQIGHKPNFSVSLRVQTRVGGSVDGADPETTLHGDAEVIVEKLRRYREVGVQQVVIEPSSGNLTDFLEQIRLFAHEIAPNLPDSSGPVVGDARPALLPPVPQSPEQTWPDAWSSTPSPCSLD